MKTLLALLLFTSAALAEGPIQSDGNGGHTYSVKRGCGKVQDSDWAQAIAFCQSLGGQLGQHQPQDDCTNDYSMYSHNDERMITAPGTSTLWFTCVATVQL